MSDAGAVITAAGLKEMVAAGKVLMIDVRKPEELAADGYVDGACGVRELPNRIVHGSTLCLARACVCLCVSCPLACVLGRGGAGAVATR